MCCINLGEYWLHKAKVTVTYEFYRHIESKYITTSQKVGGGFPEQTLKQRSEFKQLGKLTQVIPAWDWESEVGEGRETMKGA